MTFENAVITLIVLFGGGTFIGMMFIFLGIRQGLEMIDNRCKQLQLAIHRIERGKA